jgi:acyl CoA:acetate/3-ketoacid CoA transferase alpha subunit
MSAKNKVYPSFDDAVRDIPDGATLGFGGFAVVGMPINLYAAVAKQGAKNLTCVSNSTRGGATLPADAPDMSGLIRNDQVEKVICAFTAPTRASQRLVLTEYVEKGLIEAELVPQGARRTDACRGRRHPGLLYPGRGRAGGGTGPPCLRYRCRDGPRLTIPAKQLFVCARPRSLWISC